MSVKSRDVSGPGLAAEVQRRRSHSCQPRDNSLVGDAHTQKFRSAAQSVGQESRATDFSFLACFINLLEHVLNKLPRWSWSPPKSENHRVAPAQYATRQRQPSPQHTTLLLLLPALSFFTHPRRCRLSLASPRKASLAFHPRGTFLFQNSISTCSLDHTM